MNDVPERFAPFFNDPDATLAEIDRIDCRSLRTFIRESWHVVEPTEPYVHGWHIDALADHLQAVAEGHILRLLINVPPGMMKSLSTSVFFPAWLWGPGGKPGHRIIGASYASSLAARDSRRNKMLVESQWFQRRWPITIAADQKSKVNFENDRRGFREAVPVASMTGRRGHVIIWDDPHNPEQANSDTERGIALRVLRETLPTRLIDPRSSAIIVVMQRLHEGDVAGYILSNNLGYEHLCLPMRYEPDRAKTTVIGFRDLRTVEGQLLFPERFPEHVVERDRRAMGEYAYAGQYQQRPAPRLGAVFHPDRIERLEAAPACTIKVRAWDLGGTENGGDATAGILLGLRADGRLVILDERHGRHGPETVQKIIRETAAADGHDTVITLPQEPGQAGIAQKIGFINMLAGYAVRTRAPQTSKVTRALPFAAQVNAGNVSMLSGPWNDELLDELRLFPSAVHDDRVDALSDAFAEITELSTGGLWTIPAIARSRLATLALPSLSRAVVSVCPPSSAEHGVCGIILAGIDQSGLVIVTRDLSTGAAVAEWSKAAVEARRANSAAVVAELGHEGALVRREFSQSDPSTAVQLLRAGSGGDDYAQAVAQLYASGRVMHALGLGELEAQLLAFRRDDRRSAAFTRAKALIWAVAALTFARGTVETGAVKW